MAYADPPYLGLAKKFYGKIHPDAAAYDDSAKHAELIERLCSEYSDGWAMSTNTPSLRTILALCPPDVRIGAWVKPFASFKPGVNPAYAWEPVIFSGGRQPRLRTEDTVRDWTAVGITLKRGLTGAKPEAFCFWIFDLLGLTPDDEFCDLFYGSGAVSRAWQKWRMSSPTSISGQLFELPI